MKLIDILTWIPVEKLYLLYEKIRIRRLTKIFSQCGKGIILSKNLYVECPEKLIIEDEASLGCDVSIMGIGGVLIGKGTMIAKGAKIITTTHDSNAPLMRVTSIHKPVSIGKEVWIGAGAIILPGIKIGDHAIVGAGAVVTNDVEEYQVVAGVPARVVRYRNVEPINLEISTK